MKRVLFALLLAASASACWKPAQPPATPTPDQPKPPETKPTPNPGNGPKDPQLQR